MLRVLIPFGFIDTRTMDLRRSVRRHERMDTRRTRELACKRRTGGRRWRGAEGGGLRGSERGRGADNDPNHRSATITGTIPTESVPKGANWIKSKGPGHALTKVPFPRNARSTLEYETWCNINVENTKHEAIDARDAQHSTLLTEFAKGSKKGPRQKGVSRVRHAGEENTPSS